MKIENISDYSSYKVLHQFTKKRSPRSVMIVTDHNDDWFVYVLEYKTKTGEITYNSMIIKPDLEVRLSSLNREGYELKK